MSNKLYERTQTDVHHFIKEKGDETREEWSIRWTEDIEGEDGRRVGEAKDEK